MIRAVDVYTGRVLWEKSRCPACGDELFNYTGHQPGANATGSNYVSVPKTAVYVAYQYSKCLRLDPETGENHRPSFPCHHCSTDGDPEMGLYRRHR